MYLAAARLDLVVQRNYMYTSPQTDAGLGRKSLSSKPNVLAHFVTGAVTCSLNIIARAVVRSRGAAGEGAKTVAGGGRRALEALGRSSV